ncbi:unnamed protein product [Closterium sp. NIES-64]|nr:unnamed protein product [Closterium sp. NIES-64]
MARYRLHVLPPSPLLFLIVLLLSSLSLSPINLPPLASSPLLVAAAFSSANDCLPGASALCQRADDPALCLSAICRHHRASSAARGRDLAEQSSARRPSSQASQSSHSQDLLTSMTVDVALGEVSLLRDRAEQLSRSSGEDPRSARESRVARDCLEQLDRAAAYLRRASASLKNGAEPEGQAYWIGAALTLTSHCSTNMAAASAAVAENSGDGGAAEARTQGEGEAGEHASSAEVADVSSSDGTGGMHVARFKTREEVMRNARSRDGGRVGERPAGDTTSGSLATTQIIGSNGWSGGSKRKNNDIGPASGGEKKTTGAKSGGKNGAKSGGKNGAKSGGKKGAKKGANSAAAVWNGLVSRVRHRGGKSGGGGSNQPLVELDTPLIGHVRMAEGGTEPAAGGAAEGALAHGKEVALTAIALGARDGERNFAGDGEGDAEEGGNGGGGSGGGGGGGGEVESPSKLKAGPTLRYISNALAIVTSLRDEDADGAERPGNPMHARRKGLQVDGRRKLSQRQARKAQEAREARELYRAIRHTYPTPFPSSSSSSSSSSWLSSRRSRRLTSSAAAKSAARPTWVRESEYGELRELQRFMRVHYARAEELLAGNLTALWEANRGRRLAAVGAKLPKLKPDFIVSKTGKPGHCRTVQEAATKLIAAYKPPPTRFVVYIMKGTYAEKVLLNKNGVIFLGEGAKDTVITYGASVSKGYTAFDSASVGVNADGFTAMGLTVVNNAGSAAGQAIALRTEGDKSAFYECVFLGHQVRRALNRAAVGWCRNGSRCYVHCCLIILLSLPLLFLLFFSPCFPAVPTPLTTPPPLSPPVPFPLSHDTLAPDVGRQSFRNCTARGYHDVSNLFPAHHTPPPHPRLAPPQDTLAPDVGRQYFRNCTVRGTIDFVFGVAAAVFEDCTFIVRRSPPGYSSTVAAQGRVTLKDPSAFVFLRGKVVGESAGQYGYLARPWWPYSRTIFIQTYLSPVSLLRCLCLAEHPLFLPRLRLFTPLPLLGAFHCWLLNSPLSPRLLNSLYLAILPGWLEWSDATTKTIWGGRPYFAEYDTTGPGAKGRRVAWARPGKLSENQAEGFMPSKLLQLRTWVGETKIPYSP